MLNRIKGFLQKENIDRLRVEFKDPEQNFDSFKYDPKEETRVIVNHTRDHETGNWEEEVFRESFQEEVGKKFYELAKKDFEQIESDLGIVANQNVLERKEKKLQSALSEVASLINKNFSAEKYPYLIRIFENFVDAIGEMTNIDVNSFKSYQEETRGNPNFQNKISEARLKTIIDKANHLLKEEPEIYKPIRKGAFLSENLKRELSVQFDIPESTLRDNLKKRTEKKDRLFILKNDY